MFDALNNLLSWTITSDRPISHTASVLICLVLVTFGADNIIGFSFFYKNQQKISQTIQIQELKSKYKEDTVLIKKLTAIEAEVLDRHHVIHQLFKAVKSTNLLFYDIPGISSKDLEKDLSYKKVGGSSAITRQEWFLMLSSSYLFLIGMAVYPFSILFNSRQTIIQKILQMILSLIALAFGAAINIGLLLIIPKIKEPFAINYLINIMLHTLIIVFFFQRANRSQPLTETQITDVNWELNDASNENIKFDA